MHSEIETVTRAEHSTFLYIYKIHVQPMPPGVLVVCVRAFLKKNTRPEETNSRASAARGNVVVFYSPSFSLCVSRWEELTVARQFASAVRVAIHAQSLHPRKTNAQKGNGHSNDQVDVNRLVVECPEL